MATEADQYTFQNCYDVLGLERTATAEDVKSAYRLRSHMFHPDKYENYPEPLRTQLKVEAAKEFKKLTAAYEVLRDPTKRAAHDRQLDVQYRGQGGYATAGGRARRAPSRRPRAESGAETARARRTAPPPPPRERDPLLVVRPDHLDFGTLAAGATKQLPLKISNAGGRTLFGEITSNRAWLTVNRRTFISSAAVIFVTVDTNGLHPGEEYTGTLVVSTLNGGDQVVPVVARVSGRPEPILAGVPTLLDFGVAQAGGTRGGAKAGSKARTIKLTNAGTGTLIGSVAVKGSWLAVSESRFRGNDVSFEVIAQPSALTPGPHQGQIIIFSNGGQVSIQVLIEVTAPPPGEAMVGQPASGSAGGRAAAESGADRSGTPGTPGTPGGAEAAGDAGATGAETEPGLSSAAQRELLRRITLIEPETSWEREFLSRIVQLIRSGERLAPGELAKIYELEARGQGSKV